MTAQTVAVTGASGFVGTTICRALTDAGHRVIALGRTPVTGYEHRSYELSAPVPAETLSDADAVVHCAYDLSLTDSGAIATKNVEGAASLVRAAVRSETRPVLISSMSAYPGTEQIYGRAKLASESAFSRGRAERLSAWDSSGAGRKGG